MFWLGLAWKPRLWLGLGGLWLHIPQAKAKAVREGLAWLGFGLSLAYCNICPRTESASRNQQEMCNYTVLISQGVPGYCLGLWEWEIGKPLRHQKLGRQQDIRAEYDVG